MGWRDPDTIDREVTEVLEKEFKSLPGIAKLRSASFNSFSIVTGFEATSDSAESMSKLRAKVSDAETELPDKKTRRSAKVRQRHTDHFARVVRGY